MVAPFVTFTYNGSNGFISNSLENVSFETVSYSYSTAYDALEAASDNMYKLYFKNIGVRREKKYLDHFGKWDRLSMSLLTTYGSWKTRLDIFEPFTLTKAGIHQRTPVVKDIGYDREMVAFIQ